MLQNCTNWKCHDQKSPWKLSTQTVHLAHKSSVSLLSGYLDYDQHSQWVIRKPAHATQLCHLLTLRKISLTFSSVQFSRSVVSDSLWPHKLQYARPPCPSPTSGVHSNSRVNSIESVMPSSHLILCRPLLLLSPIPPSIRVFCNESTLRMRWPKYWSFTLASFLPKNTQDWSPLG